MEFSTFSVMSALRKPWIWGSQMRGAQSRQCAATKGHLLSPGLPWSLCLDGGRIQVGTSAWHLCFHCKQWPLDSSCSDFFPLLRVELSYGPGSQHCDSLLGSLLSTFVTFDCDIIWPFLPKARFSLESIISSTT